MTLLNWILGLFRPRPTPPVPPSPPSPPTPPVVVGDLATRCITAMNAERREAGLSNLGRDDRLCRAAQMQADDCARRDVLSHIGPDRSLVCDRANMVGYSWRAIAENAAQQPKAPPGWPGGDVRTPEWAVDGWMQSPGHRANLLGPYTQVGAAYADAASGTRYWIACFATPSP